MDEWVEPHSPTHHGIPILSTSSHGSRIHAAQVVVVGGGPAGTSTAWHLARAGVDVVLVDRARFPRDKPCAEYLSPEATRILDAMGALPGIEAAGAAQLTGMQVRAPSGDMITGEFIAQHGYRAFRDHGIALRRTVLDALLLDRARDVGVDVREHTKVEQLVRDGRGQCMGVRVRTPDSVHEIRAPLVIGADGLRSVIARRLGLSRMARWPKRIALVAHYAGVSGMGSLGEMHVTRNGYLGLASVGHGVTNVALVVPKHCAPELSGRASAFVDAWIADQPALSDRFVGATRIDAVHTTGPFASRAIRAWAPGAMLVGDAADFYDPFTGEGIYAALRGGELLMPYAMDALRAPRAELAHRALRAYDHERRAIFSGKWRVERMIGMAVAFPALINRAVRALSHDRALSDLLVGVTGDFVPPREVLRGRVLFPLLARMLSLRMT